MKRWMVYLVLIAAVVLTGSLPFSSHDVGQLRPVETIFVQQEDGRVLLAADTGDTGAGEDWQTAMADLEARAPGTIFIGTASFLLLDVSAAELLPELLENREFSPSCAVCFAPEGLDLEDVGKYLRAHEPEADIRTLRAERTPLPYLTQTDGGYLLVQP